MKKYTPEYLYSIWLAVHLHFNEQKFELSKYPRVNRKPNNRILARLRPIADQIPAKYCRSFIIANYVEQYREGDGQGSAWLYNKSFPEMRDCYDRYKARMRNIDQIIYDDIIRLLMANQLDEFLLDFEQQELYNEFLEFIPTNPSDRPLNRWDWLGNLPGSGDLPLMLELFFSKRFSIESICYIMALSTGQFWDRWTFEFGSSNSFPNYQNDFLFLYKYNRILNFNN